MISYWANVEITKKDSERTTVDEFLDRVQSGYWKTQIELLRSETDEARQKIHKTTLPAVTIGGTFTQRMESKLERHSGFICIDVDDYTDRSKINQDEYTYASFLSARGNGFAVICKIDPSKHKESYNFIAEYYYQKYGVSVDPAPKNVASMRFVSYDPDLFRNEKAKKLRVKTEKKKSPPSLSIIVPKGEVSDLVNQVNTSVVDEYHDYLSLSFALAVGFGENGRAWFHKLSAFSDKYDPKQCDMQYDIALKRNGSGITVGTFYYYLKRGGADLTRYKADKDISNIKLNKRLEIPKQVAIEELKKSKGLDDEQASEIVNEVYARNDLDIRTETTAENIIINCTNYIIKKFKIRKNVITRKYEWNGVPMYDKEFNTVFLDCRMTFDDKSITADLVDRIIKSNAIPEYNPFFEYVEANKHRISTGNIDRICKSINSNTAIKDRYIRKWLIGMIASINGYPVRYILALTGGQNTGKTEWFRRLLPASLKPYYAESNLDRGKDDELLMCEKLIVVDDEMGGKSKQDEKKMKELTSKHTFSLRAAYGRYNEDYKRLAILGGTSNDHQLINDSTGNTRILPINVISIDHELYNSVDKDDLFIELFRAYNNGEDYLLEQTELDILSDVSKSFESVPFERELIHEFFSIPKQQGEWLTATQIKDHIEASTKQRIMSMKKFGMELRMIFGAPRFKDRQNKYFVEKLKTLHHDIATVPGVDYKSDSQPF